MPLLDPSILNQTGDPLAEGFASGMRLRDMVNQSRDAKRSRQAQKAFQQFAQGQDITTKGGLTTTLKAMAQGGYAPEALKIFEANKDLFAEAKPQKFTQEQEPWDVMEGTAPDGSRVNLQFKKSDPAGTIRPLPYGPKAKEEKPPKEETWDKVETDEGYIDYVNTKTGLNREGKRVKFYKSPNSGQPPRDRFRFETINGRKWQINLDSDEKTDLGPAEAQTVKDLNPTEIKELSALGNKRDNVKYIVDGFKDDYSGVGNATQNLVGRYTGTSKDQVLWWQGYQGFVNQVRNDLFGASLTAPEKAEFEKTIVTTGMNPVNAKANLARQMEIINNAVERQREIYGASKRANQEQVNAALGTPKTAPAPAKKQAAPTAEDSEAVKWAKQNPNDPRAAEILRLNGVQ